MKHILVCGGAGYIGSHMSKMLVRDGYRVTVFDDLSTGHIDLVRWGTLIEGNLLRDDDLERAFAGSAFDAVMHFGAKSVVADSVRQPDVYYRNNLQGTLNLLEAVKRHGVSRFIFSSTAAVYGTPRCTPIDENHPTEPINPYGRSKLMVETLLRDYATAFDLRSVSLRYFNAAGADADNETGECHHPETHLIPNILRALTCDTGEDVAIFGDDYATTDGTCVRDYVHVADICTGHMKALDYLMRGGRGVRTCESFNLGSGRGCSVLEVIRTAEDVTGEKIPFHVEQRRPGDPSVLVASSAKAEAVLGWRKRHSNLHDILSTAWRWHRRTRSTSSAIPPVILENVFNGATRAD